VLQALLFCLSYLISRCHVILAHWLYVNARLSCEFVSPLCGSCCLLCLTAGKFRTRRVLLACAAPVYKISFVLFSARLVTGHSHCLGGSTSAGVAGGGAEVTAGEGEQQQQRLSQLRHPRQPANTGSCASNR
jgi:hypothetical protein